MQAFFASSCFLDLIWSQPRPGLLSFDGLTRIANGLQGLQVEREILYWLADGNRWSQIKSALGGAGYTAALDFGALEIQEEGQG